MTYARRAAVYLNLSPGRFPIERGSPNRAGGSLGREFGQIALGQATWFKSMKTFTLQKQIWLPRPLPDVFRFFADAANLEVLTPPWLSFHILTPRPIEMKTGTRIDYKLRVHGIPVRWQSEITVWSPPERFVDEQRRGPYRHWIHEHKFRTSNGGTIVEDLVHYAVWGGELINGLMVSPDLKKIFDYRHRKLVEITSVDCDSKK
jgi:ligand-binding SRPBCC domain-containing protein